MFIEVEHRLSLDYDAFVRESFLELRMQPKSTEHQTLRSFVLAVGPPSKIGRYRDWNDNLVHHFSVTNFHDRIAIAGRSLVQTHPRAPRLEAVRDRLPLVDVPFPLRDFQELGGPVRSSGTLQDFQRTVDVSPSLPLGEQVARLGALLRQRFRYRKGVTRYDSTTDDFLALGEGVCQDFTHLMLALLRLRGAPCRYVSGYLHVEPRPGEGSQSHAWIELWTPAHGWVPFDATHARELDGRYVAVAHGRHYADVPPNKGIFRGSAVESLTAEVYTRPAADKAVSTLHEEIEGIDLPVFREVPSPRRDWSALAAAEAAAQQAQQ